MSTKHKSADLIVIGGGIIGASLAYRLSLAGTRVTILERREIGREASWASAGILSSPGPHYGTRARLALDSFAQYPDLIAEVEARSGINVGYVPTGEVEAGTSSDVSAFQNAHEWRLQNGVACELLDGAALREAEPALHERFDCGAYTPGAGSVMLGQLAVAFAKAAQTIGATVREHAPVSRIKISSGRAVAVETFDGEIPAGGVVIAAGAWSRSLGASIDLPIATRPVRGQMMAVANPPIPLRSVIAAGGGYFVPRADGTVAIGATEEHDAGFDSGVTPAGIAELVAMTAGVVPSLNSGRLAATWAGLRPGTDDGELIIGKVPHLDNVWISSGHFRSGALLAPASADALASTILSGTPDPRIEPFDPARFR